MFNRRATAELVTQGLRLDNKTILCTGITSGIGKETARVLASRGATILGTGRTPESINRVCAEIGSNAIPLYCDMSNPTSINECLRQVRSMGRKVDVIIANAGIMAPSTCRLIQGVEQQFYINHVAHYKLISGLLDLLSEDGRVVIVSSDLHKHVSMEDIAFNNLDCSKKYDPLKSYVLSKFANVTYARILAKEFRGTQRKAIAVHPGLIPTNIVRYQNVLIRSALSFFGKIFFKTIEQGAATQCFAAVHPNAAAPNTGYMEDCKETKTHPEVNNFGVQDRLMTITKEIASRG